MERLRTITRAAYGAGELGPAMAGSTMIFFQFVFLTNVAGLQPGLAGSVLLIGKVWDAVNDPVIGWLSDRTRSAWGRRLPWMMGAAIPFALFFVLQWYVPGFAREGNQWGLFAYYVLVSIVYNTLYTALALPHSSLTAELSNDYDERSRITGFRMAFSLGGSVGGLLAMLAVFAALPDASSQQQYLVSAIAIAVIAVTAVAVCILGIRKTVIEKEAGRIAKEVPHRPLGIRQQLQIVLQNRPFLIVCGIYLASWLAMQFTATILPIYVVSCMGLTNELFQAVALTVQVTALILIPAWGWLSVRVGKKPVYFYGMAFWLAAQAGLLFLQPGQTTFLFTLGLIAGFGISVCYLIPNAMLPDTLEYDELMTGERREGIFYGIFVFLQKMALALGTFVVGQVLEQAGYVPTGPGEALATQPESALTAIRFAIGPLPALALIVGMILAAIYPLTKARHAEILAELARRRAVAAP